MKIGPIENKAAVSPAVNERKSSAGGAPRSGQAAEPSAQVELSPSATLGIDSGAAVFDGAKVQRIADAIREGRFVVNHEAIADKLIANAKELLKPAHKG